MLNFFQKKYVIIALLFVLFIILILSFLYFTNFTFSKNLKIQNKNEAEVLYSRVGRIFVLPEGELPTIATVTEPEKLKGQSFFSKAKKGDKVLIFTNAREAILYDPIINKVITVAPINIDENNPNQNSLNTNPNSF